MALDPIPCELQYLKLIEKFLISKIILFKKLGEMHRKGNFVNPRRAFVTFP